MTEQITLTVQEVAAILAMSPAVFLRKRKELTQNGLPLPVPGTKVYPRAKVEQWINSAQDQPPPRQGNRQPTLEELYCRS